MISNNLSLPISFLIVAGSIMPLLTCKKQYAEKIKTPTKTEETLHQKVKVAHSELTNIAQQLDKEPKKFEKYIKQIQAHPQRVLSAIGECLDCSDMPDEKKT